MMTVCPNCGKPGIGQESFCRVCGTPLQVVNPQPFMPQYPVQNGPQTGWQQYPTQNGPVPNESQTGWQQYPTQNGPVPNEPQTGWQQYPTQNGPAPNGPQPGWQPYQQPMRQQDPSQNGQQQILPQYRQPEPPRQSEQPQASAQDAQPELLPQHEQSQASVQDGQPEPPRRTRRRQIVQQDGESQDVQPQPMPPQPVPQPQQPPQPQLAPPFDPRMDGQPYARQIPGNMNPSDDSITSGEKQKNRKRILIICGIVLVIALIILLIFLLLGKGKEDRMSNPTAQSGQSAGFQRKKTDFSEFKTVGNIGTFGYYEQDNNPYNGPEPIEWIVIEVREDRALLLSRYALDAKPYNTESADTTWEQCSLRKWLNNDFLNAAFDEKEQAALITVQQNNDRIWSETNGGDETEDPVFLLSRWDVYSTGTDDSYRDRYVFADDEDRMCTATDYAIANGAWISSAYQADGCPTVCWWLRSTGYYQNSAMFVDEDGSGQFYNVSMERYAVRPAIWVNLQNPTPTPEASETPNRRKWD